VATGAGFEDVSRCNRIPEVLVLQYIEMQVDEVPE
jgi:hypothetical protein